VITNRYGSLFRWSYKAFKYYLLGLVSWLTLYGIAVTFEADHLIELLILFFSKWLMRLAAVLLSLMIIGVFVESLRD
jgi:hypothetical protein